MPIDIDSGKCAEVARERARFARELHDSLGKTLHGISLAAEAMPLWIRRGSTIATWHAEALSRASARALGELRAVTRGLRLGTAPRSEPDVDRPACSPRTPWLDAGIREQVLAVLGEALTNVHRHADAGEVTVSVRRAGEAVELRVRDDGCGFEPQSTARLLVGGHFGLIGMAERTDLVGGDLAVTSHAGEGTDVVLRLPLPVDHEPRVMIDAC